MNAIRLATTSAPPAPPDRITRAASAAVVLAVLGGLAACSADESDADDVISDALVDEEFPGDALDATCARLEATTGDDLPARAATVLDELVAIGGEEAAVNTLRTAAIDSCPDWNDAVTEAIAARD